MGKLCVVGAGSSSIYASRAIQDLRSWHSNDANVAANPQIACSFGSLVMLAPAWQTKKQNMLFRFLSSSRASEIIGMTLHSESRLARLYRSFHFGGWKWRKNFVHRQAQDKARLSAVASWLFRRPRPYVQTDAAISGGLLDPPSIGGKGVATPDEIAKEVTESSSSYHSGVLVLSSDPTGDLAAALQKLPSADQSDKVTCQGVQSESLLPQEVATSS